MRLLCVQVDDSTQLFHTRDAAQDLYDAVLLHRRDALRAGGLVYLALRWFGAQNGFYRGVHKHRLKYGDAPLVSAAVADLAAVGLWQPHFFGVRRHQRAVDYSSDVFVYIFLFLRRRHSFNLADAQFAHEALCQRRYNRRPKNFFVAPEVDKTGEGTRRVV